MFTFLSNNLEFVYKLLKNLFFFAYIINLMIIIFLPFQITICGDVKIGPRGVLHGFSLKLFKQHK